LEKLCLPAVQQESAGQACQRHVDTGYAPTLMLQIDLSGHNTKQFIIDGPGPDVLIAIGCSWTRAWGAVDNCSDFDIDYCDDLNFYNNNSFVGKISDHLALSSKIVMALPGSNNDTQTRLLIELLQKNRKQFGRVFVLWGITSHLRWELYSNKINAPSMYMLGSRVPTGKDTERKWHMVHHWNNEFELERLGQKIVTTSSYLKMLDVDHLFFPVFESYNNNNMNLNNVDAKNYFNINESCNDMLHLWAQEQQVSIQETVLSNPYCNKDKNNLQSLINAGYLNKVHAHPSVKGHADIASKLIQYIDATRSC
jgi:hypothetical protein